MTAFTKDNPFYDRFSDGLGRRRRALRAGRDPETGQPTDRSPASVGRPLTPRRRKSGKVVQLDPGRDRIFD